MNDVMEIIASVSECFIVVRLCYKFLGYKKRETALIGSVFYFILISIENVLLSQRDGYALLSLGLLLALTFGYSMIFLSGKIYEKILISFIPIMIILPINLITLNFFRFLTGCFATDIVEPGGSMRLPVLVLSKLAFFFVCEFLIHMSRRGGYSLSSLQWFVQLSCFATTYLIGVLLWNISVSNDEISLYFGASILLAVQNILLYIVMDKMQRDNLIKEEYEISRVNLAAQERFVDEARERYTEMRTLRHDMRHYLLTAAELISVGKAEDAKDYIERIIYDKVNPSADGIDTGSVVIDAVINNRIAKCLNRNIEVKCMIDSRFKDVNEMDVSILLSNVLDNAIRGCHGAAAPKIEMVIGKRKTFTYIIVKNSIMKSVLAENPDLKTDKKDKLVHGFGIMSIRKIAEKYGGGVEFKEEGRTFITEIWLESTN